jgi:hypothetical protein
MTQSDEGDRSDGGVGRAGGDGSRPGSSTAVWIPLSILGAVALLLVIMVVYAERILTVLAQYFPEGAVPQATIFFGLAGLAVAAITLSNIREAARSRGWPVTQGRISRSELEKVRLSPGARRGATVTAYRPLVEYEYRVDGLDYRSRSVRLGATRATTKERASAELAPFAVGSTIQVHYDPAVPDRALLETRVGLLSYTALIGLLLLGLAVYFSGLL